MGQAHDYATAILHRGRVPMEPADFVPDWADGPRKGKYYPGVDALPLPDGAYPATATVDRGLAAENGPPEQAGRRGGFDLDTLSGMLRDSYGLTGRRIAVQANSDLSALPFYPLANWSRGTASGGGLYPVNIHWVSGPSGQLPPGVHYYSTRHHALQRLLTGDVSGEVRDALGEGAPGADTDQFLLLTVKYWQNAFKYNSFSFHVVSMDVGACLQTWRIWARARGLDVEPAFWFDEERLNRLLGARGEEESVFAVVPLRRTDTGTPPVSPAVSPAAHGAAVGRRDVERSRTVLSFDTVRAMHDATAAGAADRPAPGALAGAAAPPANPAAPLCPLPEPPPLTADVRTALRRRRSSFGRFDPGRPMAAAELTACLRASAAGARLGGDVRAAGPPDGQDLVKLYAFVNHCADVPSGVYAYDDGGEDEGEQGLRLVREGPSGDFLQRNYFLNNYNLEHAGAVLAVTARPHAALDAVGDRGYRLVGACIGGAAQALYTACAAMGLGCGVALGFDNVSYIEELGITDTGESPLLIMMVGNEHPEPAAFHHEIA